MYVYIYIYIYTIAPVGMKNSIGKTKAQNAMVVFVLKKCAKLYYNLQNCIKKYKKMHATSPKKIGSSQKIQ